MRLWRPGQTARPCIEIGAQRLEPLARSVTGIQIAPAGHATDVAEVLRRGPGADVPAEAQAMTPDVFLKLRIVAEDPGLLGGRERSEGLASHFGIKSSQLK